MFGFFRSSHLWSLLSELCGFYFLNHIQSFRVVLVIGFGHVWSFFVKFGQIRSFDSSWSLFGLGWVWSCFIRFGLRHQIFVSISVLIFLYLSRLGLPIVFYLVIQFWSLNDHISSCLHTKMMIQNAKDWHWFNGERILKMDVLH